MTVTLNNDALRKRAAAFSKEFSQSKYEMGEAQDFIRGLCHVFDLNHRRAVSFEERVKKLGGKRGRIDGLFPGLLLVEMKSAGEDLDKAYIQATEYFPGLNDEEMPRCVLVSDFTNLHLYNLESKAPPLKIKLADFPQAIEHFKFIAGYETIAVQQQTAINQHAAEKMAGLHDVIKATGYQGKDLETYLIRLLFCLFAEDTGLFDGSNIFLDYITNHTKVDGSDLHGALTSLFDTLNRSSENRPNNLPETLAEFPYINGALFKEHLAQCYFDEASRKTLVECAQLDWDEISPAIFGSLFQAIMHFDDEAATGKTKKRRELGAHYTSEENILKVIRPLFLDDLVARFKKCGRNKKHLSAFHQHLSKLNFFDPACGCGNFLVIAYRELRLLELEVIEALWGDSVSNQLDIDTLILCNVHQFHGIEIDDSAAQIATVALWLTDHQMNLKVQHFGLYYKRIPLAKKANIVCANALQIDWTEVLPPENCSFIMGNPPFIGRQYQSQQQKADLTLVCQGISGAGVLDYVAAWYIKATAYIKQSPAIPVAFVSTNSICQGEQVGILWRYLFSQGIQLHFAHRTFRWSNEGKGIAAVHCVIVGFGLTEPKQRLIYDYGDNITGEPDAIIAKNINPYLVDAPNVFIDKRRKPLCANVPVMVFGNMPNDGGHLLLTPDEAEAIRQNDPIAAKYIRPFLGAEEFINGGERYCLWLKDSTATDRKASPEIQRRIKKVEVIRLASAREATQKLAEMPYLFGEIRQKSDEYLAIPEVSSERRAYLPIGYLSNVIASNKLYMIAEASLYHFGVLTSTMHNTWMRAVCGRLKSDYQYSAGIVYNNFPWPETSKDSQQQKIAEAAQQILDERQAEVDRCTQQGQTCSLATLYAAGNMPAGLVKAHAALDKAVDAAYSYKGGKDDAARVAFLFGLYQQLVGSQ